MLVYLVLFVLLFRIFIAIVFVIGILLFPDVFLNRLKC